MTAPQEPSQAAPGHPGHQVGQPDPRPSRAAAYKGELLDAERGPGLGCFWIQMAALVFLLVLTPLSVTWAWPEWVSAVLLVLIILVLLFAGQTVIFLLRLVAAGRGEGRRRPLASGTPTVGDLEETAAAPEPDRTADPGVRE